MKPPSSDTFLHTELVNTVHFLRLDFESAIQSIDQIHSPQGCRMLSRLCLALIYGHP